MRKYVLLIVVVGLVAEASARQGRSDSTEILNKSKKIHLLAFFAFKMSNSVVTCLGISGKKANADALEELARQNALYTEQDYTLLTTNLQKFTAVNKFINSIEQSINVHTGDGIDVVEQYSKITNSISSSSDVNGTALKKAFNNDNCFSSLIDSLTNSKDSLVKVIVGNQAPTASHTVKDSLIYQILDTVLFTCKEVEDFDDIYNTIQSIAKDNQFPVASDLISVLQKKKFDALADFVVALRESLPELSLHAVIASDSLQYYDNTALSILKKSDAPWYTWFVDHNCDKKINNLESVLFESRPVRPKGLVLWIGIILIIVLIIYSMRGKKELLRKAIILDKFKKNRIKGKGRPEIPTTGVPAQNQSKSDKIVDESIENIIKRLLQENNFIATLTDKILKDDRLTNTLKEKISEAISKNFPEKPNEKEQKSESKDTQNKQNVAEDYTGWRNELEIFKANLARQFADQIDQLRQELPEIYSKLSEGIITDKTAGLQIGGIENAGKKPILIDDIGEFKPASSSIFYMGWPTEMYFGASAKSDTPPNTYFTFTVDNKNATQATYVMHQNGKVPLKEILKGLREIKYACKEEKPFSDRLAVNNIVTLIPGTAELRGENWVIINKAVIRYE